MSLLTISKLQHGYPPGSLIARLYRIWDATIPSNKDTIMSLECSLIDEQGECIHATASVFNRKKFVYDLVEGQIYRFSGFNVNTSYKTYKSVPRDMRIILTAHTTAEPVSNPPRPIPIRGFFPILFEDIPQRAGQKERLTDLIGFVTCAGLMDAIRSGGTEGHKRDIEIENERSQRVVVALWEDYGYDFAIEQLIQQSETKHIIIALSGLIVRTSPSFEGKILIGTSCGSRYYINDESPEIEEFRQKLQVSPKPIRRTIGRSYKSIPLEQQRTQNRKTIKELLELDNHDMEKYTIVCRIKSIDESKPWWYKSCPHCQGSFTNVNVSEGSSCPHCGKTYIRHSYSYKIVLNVEDNTGSTYFLLLAAQADGYFKTPCRTHASFIENNMTGLPLVLNNIIGKEQLFEVRRDAYASDTNLTTFMITQLFDRTVDDNTGNHGACASVDGTSIPVPLTPANDKGKERVYKPLFPFQFPLFRPNCETEHHITEGKTRVKRTDLKRRRQQLRREPSLWISRPWFPGPDPDPIPIRSLFMAEVASSEAGRGGGGAGGAMEAMFHRRIEFHPARKPYSAVSSAGASGFFLETLNPSSGKQMVQREAAFGGEKANGAAPGKRMEGGHEFFEHGLDQELGFRITFRRIGAGLANLGNTCFLNSVLQCLTYTEPFAAYLQSGKHKSSCRTAGFCALCALQNHVMSALQSTGKILSPSHLVKNLRCISRNFRTSRQEDAHEYMVNLLESMHKCCLPSGVPSESPSAYDKSLVHKIFGGRLRSQVKCMQCQYSSNKYDPFLDLSLEIAKADTVKKALSNFTAVEKLDGGEKQYQCQKCKQKVRALKQLTINKPPHVLTVHLKRFSSYIPGQKIDRKVEFDPVLDLKPFVSDPNEGNLKYTLYGVLVHAGWSTHSGHYYCFVRTSSGMWHSLDDNQVRQVSEKTVLAQKAYMLFYVRDRSPSVKNSVNHIQKENNNISNASGIKINANSNVQSNGTSNLIFRNSENVKVQVNGGTSNLIIRNSENVKVQVQANPKISNPAILKPQNGSQVPVQKPVDLQMNGNVVNSKLEDVSKVEDSVKVTEKSEKENVEKKSEKEDLEKKSEKENMEKKSEKENMEKKSEQGVTSAVISVNGSKEGNNSADFNKDKDDLAKPDELELQEKKTEINGKLVNETAVIKDDNPKIEGESTKEKVVTNEVPVLNKTEEKISHKSEIKSKKILKRSAKTAYLGQTTLFLTTIMLRKNKKLKRAKRRRLVSKEADDVASTSALNDREFITREDKSHKRKRGKKGKQKKEESRSENVKEKEGDLSGNVEGLKDDLRNIKSSLDEMKVKESELKEESRSENVKEKEGLFGRESIGLLMSGLTEIKVPRWDEKPRVEINNGPSNQNSIGYVLDEWDEEYDMGKRKKVRKSKEEFEGPNPFQEIADMKVRKKMKFKAGHFGSGSQPLRI
ncbi:hypothetical protein LUZ60_000818 [Juncus effusus]|nr:hypothetical protein LUZ60_000818 [Juncus effusus]